MDSAEHLIMFIHNKCNQQNELIRAYRKTCNGAKCEKNWCQAPEKVQPVQSAGKMQQMPSAGKHVTVAK